MSIDPSAEPSNQLPQSTRSNPLPRSSAPTRPPLPNNLSEPQAQHIVGSDMDEDEAEAGSILIALANQSCHARQAAGTSGESINQTSKPESDRTMRRSSMSIRSLIDDSTTWPPEPSAKALDKKRHHIDQQTRSGSLVAASYRQDQSDGYRDPGGIRYQSTNQYAYDDSARYAIDTNSSHPRSSEYFHGQKIDSQNGLQTPRYSHPSESSRAPHPTNPSGYQSRQVWASARKTESASIGAAGGGKGPVDVRQHRLLLTPKIRRNALHAYISYLTYADIAAMSKRQRSKHEPGNNNTLFRPIDRGQSSLQAKAPPFPPPPPHPGMQYPHRQGPHLTQAGVSRSYSTPMYSTASSSSVRPVASSSSYLRPTQQDYYYSHGTDSTGTVTASNFAPSPSPFTPSGNRDAPVAFYPNEIPSTRYLPEEGPPHPPRQHPEGNIIHSKPLTAYLRGEGSEPKRKQ
ncbi:hypothetical protein VTP01DRAFT_3217 [Rhizomucor pusillus]|uniref:uncharacterized protein n=1 Tax=Rhizomucor pusillus TaxID=4840 RepID=UPI003742BF30